MSYSYESLLRTIYGFSERTSFHGADSDMYKNLLNSMSDDNEFYYELGAISTYIEEALRQVKSNFADDSVFVGKIKDCQKLLSSHTKEGLDDCIKQSLEVVIDYYQSKGLNYCLLAL